MVCAPPGSSGHGDSPGKNTGVGCHALHHLVGKIPWRGKGYPLQYSGLENSSPWGRKELDTTEQFSLTHSLQYYEDSLLRWSESSFGFSVTSYRKTQTFWPTQYCMKQEKGGELPK